MMCVVSKDGHEGLMEYHEFEGEWPADDEEEPPYALYTDWRIGDKTGGCLVGFERLEDETPAACCALEGLELGEVFDPPEPAYSLLLDWIWRMERWARSAQWSCSRASAPNGRPWRTPECPTRPSPYRR